MESMFFPLGAAASVAVNAIPLPRRSWREGFYRRSTKRQLVAALQQVRARMLRAVVPFASSEWYVCTATSALADRKLMSDASARLVYRLVEARLGESGASLDYWLLRTHDIEYPPDFAGRRARRIVWLDALIAEFS